MKTSLRLLTLAAGLALPVAAGAQTYGYGQNSAVPATDQQYCAKLADMYIYYLGHAEWSPYNDVHRGSNDALVASTQCKSNTTGAIAVLERRLRDAKFTLPPRG